jgi:Tol biopolymer transport system component
MSSHTRFERLSAAGLDFALTPGEQLEADGHLATCPQCRRILAGYQADAAVLRAMAFSRPPARVEAAVLAAAAARPRVRGIPPWKVLAAAALLITALLAMAVAIGAFQTRPSLVITVPTVSPGPTPTRTATPSPRTSAVASPQTSGTPVEPSVEPAVQYAPPLPQCPSPADQVRLPDVTVSTGGGAGVLATRGSSVTATCTTTGTDDAIPAEPTQVIAAAPGAPLALAVPTGWGFLHIEGFDGPLAGEGANITPGFDSTLSPRVEVPGPARAGDSKVGFDVWLISDDNRVVGQLAITVRVRVTATTPAGSLLFFRGVTAEGDRNGSAWVVPLSGGAPLEVGPAVEASWAADGRSIHVVSQDAACVPTLTTVSPTGKVQAVVGTGLQTLDGAFAWSPDGRQVVFSRYHNRPPSEMCGSQGGTYGSDQVVQDIVVMDADGTNQRVLAPLVWTMRPIEWSPDGTRIAFSNTIVGGPATALDPTVVRVSDGVQSTLALVPLDGVTSPRWSPDGTRLAFSTFIGGARHTAVINIAKTQLADLGPGDETGQEPSWSPDGGRLAVAFASPTGDAVNDPGGIRIHLTGGSSLQIVSLPDIETFSTPPSWSSDGTWVAYIRTSSDGTGSPGIGLAGMLNTTQDVPDTAGAQWVAWQPTP